MLFACYIWHSLEIMDVTRTDTNAIIIGAGPAGAGTSIYLTKAGIPHVVIEKDLFPRDKVCGDACSGKTAFVLRKANPSWVQEIFSEEEKYLPNNGIVFVAPNGKSLNIPYGPNKNPGEKAPGFTSKRLVFDNFLFEKMQSEYCTVYQQAAVSSIEKKNGKVEVTFTQNGVTHVVTAPFIVGADGDKSIVRKHFINDDQSDKTYAVGLRAYYSGVKGMQENNYIELHFLPEILPGYFWIFPLPNGMANVGVGILSEKLRSRKINLREKMLNAIKTNPNMRQRFADAKLEGKILGWGLPMCMQQQPVSGDNFLLTGDAGSLVDPFSGEGIGNALYSGMLAAYAIENALKEQRFDREYLKQEYDNVLYKRIWDEMKISATLQKLCQYPWLFNFVVNKANKSPSLSTTISHMFTDIDLRDQLRKPSFYFKILFNR